MKIWILLWFSSISVLVAQITVTDNVNAYINAKEYKKAKSLLLTEIKTNASLQNKDLLADVYSYLREWDKAIPIYKELISKNPKNANYHFKYGGAVARKAESSSRLRALGLIGTIKKSFLKASKLDAKHVDTRWGLIDFYVSVPSILGGGASKAYTYAGDLQKINPIEGHFAYAYLYANDDKPDKAKKHYLKTLEYIPAIKNVKRNQLNYLIGKVCGDYNRNLDIGIYRMKIYIQKHTVKDGVSLSEAYYRLAKLYRLKNDKKNANTWISKALVKESDFKLAKEEKKRINAL